MSINYNPDDGDPIPTIFDYVENMRCSLWDVAFFREFRVPGEVHKNHTVDKQPSFFAALRRVLYRYFKYVLLPRKAIPKIPPFFSNYLDPSSDEYMYTPGMVKAWDPCHHERCGWYMDCPVHKPPLFDIPLRDSLQPLLTQLVQASPAKPSPDATAQTKSGPGKARVQAKGKGRGLKRKAPEPVEELQEEDITAVEAMEFQVKLTQDAVKPSETTKKQCIGVSPLSVQNAFTPPSLKSLTLTQPGPSSARGSKILVLNDSFPAMVEFKAKRGNVFPPSYDKMVDFLTKVLS